MARYSSRAVISFFSGEDEESLKEMYFSGSDDELGMDDELEDDSEPDFEPLEVPQGSIKKLYYYSSCNK